MQIHYYKNKKEVKEKLPKDLEGMFIENPKNKPHIIIRHGEKIVPFSFNEKDPLEHIIQLINYSIRKLSET